MARTPHARVRKACYLWTMTTLVALTVIGLALAGLTLDGFRQRRIVRGLERDLVLVAWEACAGRAAAARLEQDVMNLSARLDRMQKKLPNTAPRSPGWGDSLDLTKFDWRKPGPF